MAPPQPSAPIAVAPVRYRKVPPSPAELRVRAANRLATREPQARAFVNAAQVYPFSDGVLYRLFAAPERVTDIALQPGETVISVAAGDTVRWTVGDTTSGAGETRTMALVDLPEGTYLIAGGYDPRLPVEPVDESAIVQITIED